MCSCWVLGCMFIGGRRYENNDIFQKRASTHVAKIVDTPNENLILQSKTCNSYLNCVFFTQTA